MSKSHGESCKEMYGFNWAFHSFTSDLCRRGLAAGIYTTNSSEACQYVAANCEANILVVENQKQLDKILQVRSFITALALRVRHVITICKDRKKSVLTWRCLICLSQQVKDQLPHLKAIVQYKGELQQKAPFLYTVGSLSKHIDQAVTWLHNIW